MDNNLNAAYDACNSFNNKLKDTIMGLINANTDRKKEIDGLRADHDKLRQDHNSFENSATRENDLRWGEIVYFRSIYLIYIDAGRMRSSRLRRGPRRITRLGLTTSTRLIRSMTPRTRRGLKRSRL